MILAKHIISEIAHNSKTRANLTNLTPYLNSVTPNNPKMSANFFAKKFVLPSVIGDDIALIKKWSQSVK